MKKEESIKKLQSLVNIGPATANRLYSIGITTPRQLKRSNPERVVIRDEIVFHFQE
jgi:predicted flap endonuclease-1-like 5' DNA nuclease